MSNGTMNSRTEDQIFLYRSQLARGALIDGEPWSRDVEQQGRRLKGSSTVQDCSSVPNAQCLCQLANDSLGWERILDGGQPQDCSNPHFHSQLVGFDGDMITRIFVRFYQPPEAKLPELFGELTSLTLLALAGPHLKGSLPCAWADLSHLQLLRVADSRGGVRGTVPQFLLNLSALRYLYLSSNSLHGALPSVVVTDCSLPMENLQLNNNLLSGSCQLHGQLFAI